MMQKFINKKIAVVGLSTEGIDTVKYFTSQNIPVTACDKKELWEMDPETAFFLKNSEQKLHLGKKYLDDLNNFDLIFRTPGLPLWYPKIKEAQKKGVLITSQTKFFFEHCPASIIGITGTKGKGTTCSLIAEILHHARKNVYLGGNIGEPLLTKLPQIKKNSWVIMEISSFQLEDLHISPHIAVVLNITSDHLASGSKDSPNYHLAQKDYLMAKENIVKNQKDHDFAVINYDYNSSRQLAHITKASVWYFSRSPLKSRGAYVFDRKIYLNDGETTHYLAEIGDITLRGEHNLENVTAAAVASYLAKAPPNIISKTIKSFKGLEHRLEFVREVNGVKYYNDSFSTTPETAIAAIKSFTEPKILILGGSEKGTDFNNLGKIISKENIRLLILIGQMADIIEKAINKAGFVGTVSKNQKNMFEVVSKASQFARKGDVVLLSPSCASFGMFKNYKDRGLQFKNLVNNL